MSWIDICAAIAAMRHAGRPCVTASIDELHFLAPVNVGWVVSLSASVNYVGKTSMEVGVRVEAESPLKREKFHTASAYLTFVALDDQRKPMSIPELIAETPREKNRMKAAEERRRLRQEHRELLKKYKK